MEILFENMKTAILYRQRAREERHQLEAEKKKKEFLEKLHLETAGQKEAREVEAALNGADAEKQRGQLITMLMSQTSGSL